MKAYRLCGSESTSLKALKIIARVSFEPRLA